MTEKEVLNIKKEHTSSKPPYVAFFIFLAFVIAWTIFLFNYTPAEIVELVGVENGFIIAFIAALLGGISTFSSVPYTIIIITLGAGGLSPIGLGLVAALGLFFGDTTSYFLGYSGNGVVPSRLQEKLQRFHTWLVQERFTALLPVFIFLYGALFPFSNDVVAISFGLARYPYWKVMIPLTLGAVVFNTLMAYIGRYGSQLFS
jgi:membrane protein YqaA with SNARE-associated domain